MRSTMAKTTPQRSSVFYLYFLIMMALQSSIAPALMFHSLKALEVQIKLKTY